MVEQNNKITWKEIEYKISNGQADSLTKNVIKDFPFENTGNELRYPPWSNILHLNNLIPLLCFYLLFRLISTKVKKHLWKDFTGFKQYRLQNLTVSIIHSSVSGSLALCFAYFNTEAMFEQPLHWYKPWTKYGLLFSLGYFLHDMQDALQIRVSRYTVILYLHHLSSISAFTSALTSRKFVPFAFCALLMEANSIFLHIRNVMHLSKNSLKYETFYKFIQYINIVTFIGFRFGIQTWQNYWIFRHHNDMHIFFAIFGYCGCITFYIINGFLFVKILSADGMLGSRRNNNNKHDAIAFNRDDGCNVKQG